MSEVVVALSYGEAQAAIHVPIRPDGASAHMLDEVVDCAVKAFTALWDQVAEYDALPADDTEEAPGGDTA